MSDRIASLTAAIAALEAQRPTLGDTVVEAALAPLRKALLDARREGRAPAGQLRQVSVLFLDFVGSTWLVGRLDPEAAQRTLGGALAVLSAIVRARGGEVLNYAGDSLMAAFGADGAREDDSERAVACGLDLLAEGRRLAAQLLAEHGLPDFGVRVGIHTGPVLRGGGVDGENSLHGLAVHVAARMEQTAPPGGLRISHDTYGLVRGLFDVQAQDPIPVKGLATPMRTWLVEGWRPQAFEGRGRGIEGVATPLIGRGGELALLLGALDEVRRQRAPRAVTLLGDPGLGKSRLLHEFRERIAARRTAAWLFVARVDSTAMAQPYGLLRTLVAWRLEIADGDPADVARRKLMDGLGPWLAQPHDPSPALLGQLIGLDFGDHPDLASFRDDAQRLRSRAIDALVRWLTRLAESDGSPVVVLADDLHWADEASLVALRTVLRAPDLPLLLVAGARPLLMERHPEWQDALSDHRVVPLVALADTARTDLTQALLARVSPPSAALAALVDRQAEGNPFYAEELVRMLIDDGTIAVAADGWHVDEGRLAATRVPATLVGVLQARLESLAAEEREALLAASVIGPVFWDAALDRLRPGSDAQLPGLERRGMVRTRPESAFADSSEQSFHHHLLHQVSYDAVLPSQRRAGHAQVAAWLAERTGDRASEYLAVTAEHYARAGLEAQAFDWFARAARAAVRGAAFSMVLANTDRALAFGHAAPARDVFKVRNMRRGALDMLGDRPAEAAEIAHLQRIADELDDDTLRSQSLALAAVAADRVSDYARAETLAREAIVVGTRAGNGHFVNMARGELAWLAHLRGDRATARGELARALRALRREPPAQRSRKHRSLEIQLLLIVFTTDMALARYGPAAGVLRIAQRRAQALQDPKLEELCAGNSARIALAQRDFDTAVHHAERGLAVSRAAGMLIGEASAHNWLGEIAYHRGAFDDARAHKGVALALYRKGESHDWARRATVSLALIEDARGDWAAAQAAWTEVVTLCEQQGRVEEAGVARVCAAASALQGGDAGAAVRVAAELDALDRREAADRVSYALETRIAAWRLCAQAGDPRAARHLAWARDAVLEWADRVGTGERRERLLTQDYVHRQVLALAREHAADI
ncbi:MAG: adenylate/guanylate cyclase domain-containing protein [Burkholderiales bacterium]